MAKHNCKGCAERRIGCHSTCESYLKFVEENNKEKATARKQLELITLNSNGTMYSGRMRNMKH